MSEYRHRKPPNSMTRNGHVRGVRSTVLQVLMSVLGALIGWVSITRVPVPDRFPRSELIDQKLAEIASLEAPPVNVFIGSSHVYRSVNPVLLDQQLESRGLGSGTYNLAAQNLSPSEALETMRDLRHQGLRPQTIILEPTLNVVPRPANLQTLRVIRHMDWETTRRVLTVIADSDFSWPGKVRAGTRTLLPFADNVSGRGHLAGLWLDHLPKSEQPSLQRGYLALEAQSGPLIAERRRRFLSSIDGWRSREFPESSIRDLTSAELDLWQLVVDEASSMGAQLVFFFPPLKLRSSGPLTLYRGLSREFPAVPTIAYFEGMGPEWMYEPSLWFDHGHVAETMTGRLAEQLARDWPVNLGR